MIPMFMNQLILSYLETLFLCEEVIVKLRRVCVGKAYRIVIDAKS